MALPLGTCARGRGRLAQTGIPAGLCGSIVFGDESKVVALVRIGLRSHAVIDGIVTAQLGVTRAQARGNVRLLSV